LGCFGGFFGEFREILGIFPDFIFQYFLSIQMLFAHNHTKKVFHLGETGGVLWRAAPSLGAAT
jgi:hypothetical protein